MKADCSVTWNQYALPQFTSQISDDKQLAVIAEVPNTQGNTTTMVVKCFYAKSSVTT